MKFLKNLLLLLCWAALLAACSRTEETEAVRQLRQAAERGDAEAQNNLGVSYDHGDGIAKDDAEAVRWYRLAAEQGHAKAQNNLGTMYKFGVGVPKDAVAAVRWYRLAAEQGHAKAQYNLGVRVLA